MNLHYHPTNPDLVTKELLFIGFPGSFDLHIRDFPYQNEAYQCALIDHPSFAMTWLEERVASLSTYRPPFAVFCQSDWLRRYGDTFLSYLTKHPDLCTVPVIAFTAPDESVADHFRVDDEYSVPVDWLRLEQRLEFLNQYKSLLLERAQTLPKQTFQGYQTPLGKRVFDIFLASLAILFTGPMWLLIAAAIRLESKGPIFYKSKRAGAGYRIFDFLKFRSMYQDADKRLAELQKSLNQYANTPGGMVFVKLADDPRVTKVGRFIRKYSLDELPQFINVLRGDMSIVGNRPLPLYEAERLTQGNWCTRFMAPAGLTGLWQVTKRGKSNMSVEERIALDVQYAQQYNFWMDLRIIFRTFGAFVQHENV